MKKVNFNQSILDLEKRPINVSATQVLSMKDIVSNAICLHKGNKHNSVKLLDLALKIYNAKGDLEIDDSDFSLIKNIISNSETTVLIKGQIEKYLGDVEAKK